MNHPINPQRIEVVDERTASILRRKTGTQRVEIAFALNAEARRLMMAGIRWQHPDWDEDRVHREMVRRILWSHSNASSNAWRKPASDSSFPTS